MEFLGFVDMYKLGEGFLAASGHLSAKTTFLIFVTCYELGETFLEAASSFVSVPKLSSCNLLTYVMSLMRPSQWPRASFVLLQELRSWGLQHGLTLLRPAWAAACASFYQNGAPEVL